MGSSTRGRQDNPWSLPLHDGEDTIKLRNIVDTSTSSFDVGWISLREDGDSLPFDDRFPALSLDCAMELAMDTVMLGNEDPEVNEGVTDGSSIHSSANTEGSSGDPVPLVASAIMCQGRHRCLWDREVQRAALSS